MCLSIEGSTRARIRATTRLSKHMHDGHIGETLGDEARGFVVVDLDGHPQTVVGQMNKKSTINPYTPLPSLTSLTVSSVSLNATVNTNTSNC